MNHRGGTFFFYPSVALHTQNATTFHEFVGKKKKSEYFIDPASNGNDDPDVFRRLTFSLTQQESGTSRKGTCDVSYLLW